MKNQNQAFTLVESLLVLFIISLFFFIPSLSLKALQEKNTQDIFFASFEKRLSATQQAAITCRRVTRVYFQDNEIRFVGLRYEKNNINTLEIPSSIKRTQGAKSIVFKIGTGNYSGLTKVVFQVPKRELTVKYQFQMGSGKYTKTIAK